MTTLEDIDALIGAQKSLAGEPHWREDGSRPERALLVAPLAIEGIVPDGLQLHAHATLHTSPQRGGAALIFEGRPVQRFNVLPDHPHLNPMRHDIDPAFRGRRLEADTSRLYAWTHNRRWPRARSDNLDVGIVVDQTFADFGEALTWFATICNVTETLPPPPWMPRLIA